MRYGIFGGTFDPFHKGHQSMIDGLLESGLVDRIFVIPTGYPPRKDLHEVTLSPYRFYMVQAALKGRASCEVLPIEVSRPEPSYTVLTLQGMRESGQIKKDDEIYLIYGTDILFEIQTWYHPEIIFQEAKLLIAVRPGVMKQKTLEKVCEIESEYKTHISFFPIMGMDVSSREMRRTLDFSAAPAPVQRFISKHGLYCKENPLSILQEDTMSKMLRCCAMLFADLSEKRILHSVNVAIECVRLAIRFGVNPDAAAIAGLLHDSAKELPIEMQIRLATQYAPGEAFSRPILHAPAGAQYAIEKYHVQDESITDAIFYHTTGREKMTKLEKIVYLADKIEPARDYLDLEPIRRLAVTELDGAVTSCLIAVRDSIARKVDVFHFDSVQAINALNRNTLARSNIKIGNEHKEAKMDSKEMAEKIVSILDEKKAVDIEMIPVAEKTVLADYFVIATGTSTTHIKALSDEVEFVMKNEHKIVSDHVEGMSTGRWVLLDYKDVVVHIFHPEDREHYSLDKLWMTKTPDSVMSQEEDPEADNETEEE